MYLGSFEDEREAALAYDCKATELQADRAVLNFPPAGHCQPQLTSQYRGVCWSKVSKKWKAQITHGGKQMYLGSFDNEYEAALAYDCKATELKGERAVLNILPTGVLISPPARQGGHRTSESGAGGAVGRIGMLLGLQNAPASEPTAAAADGSSNLREHVRWQPLGSAYSGRNARR